MNLIVFQKNIVTTLKRKKKISVTYGHLTIYLQSWVTLTNPELVEGGLFYALVCEKQF